MSEPRWPVDEAYGPVLQGEGSLTGQRCMFLRLGACDGVDGRGQLCTWCDSMQAASTLNKNLWHYLTADAIVSKLVSLAPHCRYVVITGGNPVLYELDPLVIALHEEDYAIAVETQGTKFKAWLWDVEHVTASPKPPSAGFALDRELFRDFSLDLHWHVPPQEESGNGPDTTLKIVVDPDSEADRQFARELVQEWFEVYHQTYLTCLTLPDDSTEDLLARYRRLATWVTAELRLPDVAVGCQQHVLLSGHGRGK